MVEIKILQRNYLIFAVSFFLIAILVSAEGSEKGSIVQEEDSVIFNYYTFEHDFKFYNGHSAIGINTTKLASSFFKTKGVIIVEFTDDPYLELRIDELESCNSSMLEKLQRYFENNHVFGSNDMINSNGTSNKRYQAYVVEDFNDIFMSKIYIPIRRDYDGEFRLFALISNDLDDLSGSKIISIGEFNLLNSPSS